VKGPLPSSIGGKDPFTPNVRAHWRPDDLNRHFFHGGTAEPDRWPQRCDIVVGKGRLVGNQRRQAVSAMQRRSRLAR
jgi:hypothetical protein